MIPSKKNTPEDHTDVFKIFHYYVDCRIPAYYANESRSNMVGSPRYHDKVEKEKSMVEMVYRQHTTAELAVYYDRGALIIIDDPKDAIMMYDWVKSYLRHKKAQIEFNLSSKKLPMDDLHKLDAWAAELYAMARPHITEDITKSKTMRRLDAVFGNVSRMPRALADTEKRKNNDPLEHIPEDHIFISDEISKLSAGYVKR